MNNGKVVSEKEIISVIEGLDDTIKELQDECATLIGLTDSFEDDFLNIKKHWNTATSRSFIKDVDKSIIDLTRYEKKMFDFCNSVTVDIDYTWADDRAIRSGIVE